MPCPEPHANWWFAGAGSAEITHDTRLTVTNADASGNLSFVNDYNSTRDRVEIRGAPTIAVHDSSGAVAGRVYQLPGDARLPYPREGIVPDWLTVIVATTVVALLVMFIG